MRLALILLAGLSLPLGACSSSGPDEDELARAEDYYVRALHYYDAGDLARAQQQAARGLALAPENGQLNHVMGRTLLRWHDLRSVVRARPFLEAAHRELDSYKTAYSLGEYHLRYAEFLIGDSQASEEAARALEADPTAGDREARLVELRERARHTRERAAGHLRQAEELLRRTLSEVRDDVYALRLLASCLTHQGREEEALATLDQLIQVLVQSREYKNRRLASQDLRLEEEDLLRRDLLEDIDLEVEARGLAATLHKKHRDYAAAEAQLTAILALKPDLAPEYYNRGMCRYWTGRLAEAAADMETFLRKTELGPDSPEVDQAVEILSEHGTRSGGLRQVAPATGRRGD